MLSDRNDGIAERFSVQAVAEDYLAHLDKKVRAVKTLR